MDEVMAHLKTSFTVTKDPSSLTPSRLGTGAKVRRTIVTRVVDAVKALALCHNVTPVYEDVEDGASSETEADQQIKQEVTYQASSPDEVSCMDFIFCMRSKQMISHGVNV
jgi:phospholipid-translocating ATPase